MSRRSPLFFFIAYTAIYLSSPSEALSQSLSECPVFGVELLNRFSFDESSDGLVEDVVGGLSVASAGISDASGLVNGAGRFGAGSVLSLGTYDPDLSEGLTISGWVNPESFTSVEARFISKADGITASNHYLLAGTESGDALRFRLKTNGVTTTLVSSTGVLTANEWSFVSFTYDKQAMRIYHNGELVAQQAVTGEITGSTTVETLIGNQPVTRNRLYAGLLDDLRVYNGALSEAELQELMAHRAGGCVIDEEPPEIPLDLMVSETETSSESISLSWGAVSDVGDAGLGGYRLSRDGVQISEQSETGYVDTGLMPLSTYEYGLLAFDNVGNETATVLVRGMTLPDTQAPSDPVNVQAASVTDVSVRLSWEASTDEGGSGLLGYRVERGEDVLGVVSGLEYTDESVEASTSYLYRVVALDNAEPSNESDGVSVPVDTPAEPVADLGECPVFGVELLNRFSFDESSDGLVEDVVGGLSVASAGISDASGLVNGAGRFGAGSVLSLGTYDPDLSEGLTISGWVNPESFTSVEARFISKADGITASNHYLLAGTESGDALRFRLKTNGVTTTLVSSTGVLTANEWSFVSFTYDKQAMRIYHNGELVAQQAVTGEITGSTTVETLIGNQPVTRNRLYAGLLDDLRVYNGALSEAELQELMAHRAGGCGDVIFDQIAPPSPSSLQISEVSSNSVLLEWIAVEDEAGGSGLRSYILQRQGGELVEVLEGTSYLDTNLEPSTVYEYSIRAQDNARNLSEPSNISVETEVEQLPAVSLQIISPENPAVAIVDESIEFVAQISDVSFDEQVVWRSDLSGELGTGSSLQLALSAIGVHRITAEVVDSEGLIFTDQIVINVINTDVITPTEPIKLFDGDSLSPFYTWYQFTGFGPSENTIEVNSGEIKILPANNPELPTNRSEGYLITNNSFANYIAVLEFRWGDFQILRNFVRDAGLIVHSTGNNGGWRGRYMPGIEVQQSEGSMGDIILLKDDAAPMSITANTAQLDCVFDSLFCRGGFIWDPDSPIRVFTDDVTAGPNYGNLHNRVWSAAWQNQTGFRGPVDYENQHGDWNQFVVIADGDLIDVYFNGQHVNSASNVFPSAGQLQLQLEWTEYYVRRFELLPLSSNVEPIISSYSMPAAVADSAYAFVLDAESMNPPVVYSVSEGSLPVGLALDAETGTISGVPFSIGEFSFEVAVTDSVGLSSEQSFTVVVE